MVALNDLLDEIVDLYICFINEKICLGVKDGLVSAIALEIAQMQVLQLSSASQTIAAIRGAHIDQT